MLIPKASTEDVRQALTRLRRAIEKIVLRYEGQEIHVTASLGGAMVRAGEDEATIIRRADEALYASKGAGRNCVHWHDGQNVVRFDAETPSMVIERAKVAAAEPPPLPAIPPSDVLPDMINRTAFCQHVRSPSGRMESRRDAAVDGARGDRP